MDRISKFIIRWKIIIGILIPFSFLILGIIFDNIVLAIGSISFITISIAIAYAFFQYVMATS